MTKDTTFKAFLEERGIVLSRLGHSSEEYRELVKQFNEAKLQMAEENASSYKKHPENGNTPNSRASGDARA